VHSSADPSFHPLEAEDDLVNELIERSPAFRELLKESLAGQREPFPFPAP